MHELYIESRECARGGVRYFFSNIKQELYRAINLSITELDLKLVEYECSMSNTRCEVLFFEGTMACAML